MRLKRWKRPLFAAAVIGPLAMLSFSGCLGYLARAGCGQFHILWNRRPVAEVLADPATPAAVREKLRHMEVVREFARERLGLETGDIYTSYTHIDRDAAAYNVTASEELRLEPKTWWFPIVGSVPYLGFFSRAEAEEQEAELKATGYDTRVREVPAYSTLGWFDDPVLSSQMRYSRRYLTGLVIHEAAHATLWFPGDVNFNESFASFVEREGGLLFLREREGESGPSYRRALSAMAENRLAVDIFRKTAAELKRAFGGPGTDGEKRAAKRAAIEELRREFRARRREFRVLDVERLAKAPYNNAYFLAYLRYESGGDFFAREFKKCEKSWTCFFGKMRELRNLSVAERARLLH